MGVTGFTRALSSGDLVRLNPDGSIERLPERRRHRLVSVSMPMSVQTTGAACAATALDLSRSGARIEMAQDRAAGQRLRITAPGGALRASVREPLDEDQWARLRAAA